MKMQDNIVDVTNAATTVPPGLGVIETCCYYKPLIGSDIQLMNIFIHQHLLIATGMTLSFHNDHYPRRSVKYYAELMSMSV